MQGSKSGSAPGPETGIRSQSTVITHQGCSEQAALSTDQEVKLVSRIQGQGSKQGTVVAAV